MLGPEATAMAIKYKVVKYSLETSETSSLKDTSVSLIDWVRPINVGANQYSNMT